MPKIQKSSVPLFLNAEGVPVGFIFYDPVRRARIVFKCDEADEDEMVELYENKEIKK